MDILKLGASLLMDKLGGGNSDLGSISSALSGLLSDNDGNLNLGNLVSSMQEKGLGSVVESWLGDGENEAISGEQVKELFGSDKISQVASQMGADEESVLSGLSEALPQVVDKSSSGGSLLDSLGGLGGVMDMAKKLF
ncbi:MAG TPA: DUF937 domain-containing protein [Gammaproteobacteria bacterium]|nr:DUF937 domain-containing protein [Gammaproteobacteria bacterium]